MFSLAAAMHQHQPIDIAHVHVPRVGAVRSEDNQSDGRRFGGGDWAVQGVRV